MFTPRLRTLAVAVAALSLLALTAPFAHAADAADGYSNMEYLRHDIDNVARSSVSGRQLAYLKDLKYDRAFTPTASESFLTNLGKQIADISQGRQYLTLGQLLPGGSVGNPSKYHELTPTTFGFLSRTGAKLVGRLWVDDGAGEHPAIAITPGSIQGTQHMYWWAARTLAQHGFLVLTFDAQGQGESETFGHAPGKKYATTAGFPFQQAGNFFDGTIDALRFLFSTTAAPYVPGTWTPAMVTAAKAAGDGTLSWINPLAGSLDRKRLGLAGHSLGASAISAVQQCSDATNLWRALPLCLGQSYPIKAVVAWDGLSGSDVVPVVPAMNQQADGYFLNPEPSPKAPDPASHLQAQRLWVSKGVDVFSLTVRGGTHVEWVDVPYILPSTTYGNALANHYTLAWFERYVSTNPTVRVAASAELLAAAHRKAGATTQKPWRADFMSARYHGGFNFHDTAGALHSTNDLRAYGGASKVGDWKGANADKPKTAV